MNTLETICAEKREHIARQKSRISEQALQEMASEQSLPRGFHQQLKTKAKKRGFALICEIKKASPSKGLIRADFNPSELAKAYEEGGAACLSVLTDIPYFQGDDAYLGQARDVVSLPVLRKDFMLDTYQVTEARALGADCILLIMAALSDAQARELEDAALTLGMDVLIEVHDEAELERALTHMQSRLLGVNNRNLKTLDVNLETGKKLGALIPHDYTNVCESGINTADDIASMRQVGYTSFLIGESLMRQSDVAQATRALYGS